MAKGKKKDYSRYKVEEIIATITESDKSDWGKFIIRASMDDAASTIDIRHLGINKDTKEYIIGKGISMSPSETDRVTDSLVLNGYGHTGILEEAIQKRKSVYYGDPGKDKTS